VTLISETHAPDDVYDEVRKHFSETETVNLTMLIATINAWKPARDLVPRGAAGESQGIDRGVNLPDNYFCEQRGSLGTGPLTLAIRHLALAVFLELPGLPARRPE